MSLYQKASLVQIPSGYKASGSKLYSVVPSNGDGDFTISSDADATRVNKDGLIETTVANQARLNYDPTNPQDPHLLLEPTRTNSVLQSNDLSTTWVASSGVTLTANQSSPDGGTNAYKVEMTASGNRFLYITGGTTGVEYTISGYFRADANTSIGFSDGNLSPNSIDLTTEWQRFTLTYTSGSSVLIQIDNYFGVSPTQEAKTFYAFGLQAEAGSYATSLIPTSGSAVTRTEDSCFINSGLENILNTNEGTLFIDVEVPRASSISSFERIALSDQNLTTDRILFDNYGGNWRALMLSTAGNVNQTIVSVTANQRIRVAFAYSPTELRVSYDGNSATTTSGTYAPTTTLNRFRFSNKDGGNKWQGKIHQAIYFPTALTNAELQTLTS